MLIADDHQVLREGLRALSRKIDSFEIIDEARDGEELIALTHKLSPEVILTDVKMPRMDGIEATKIIKKDWPHIGVVAFSSFDEKSFIIDMIQAGAKGYLLKNASKEELSIAVQSVYRDEHYYCKEVLKKLSQTVACHNTPQVITPCFTSREIEIIRLLCDGLSSAQIGHKLGLKKRTIERYRDAIMEKMEVKSATAVVSYAFKNGLYHNPGT